MSFWGLFEENQSFYYLITLASFCLWAIGCWFLLPKTLAGRSDSWRITRQVVCSSQALWILGVLLSWGVVEETVSPRFGQFLAGLADLIAFSGFVMCIILLHRAANDLYLRDIARWLMNVLWIIVPAGLLAWSITIPTPGGGGPLSAGVSALGIMIFILLLPKYLILIIIAWSFLQMLSYNIWSKRHIRLLANRPERILSKQASMAGAAKEHLQHIEDARGAVLADDACVVCGYNLQGHAAGSVCPECGSDSRGRSQAIHPTPHEDEAGDIPLE
jgi:predicted Zn-ribbon and HTH transcriptional regulator